MKNIEVKRWKVEYYAHKYVSLDGIDLVQRDVIAVGEEIAGGYTLHAPIYIYEISISVYALAQRMWTTYRKREGLMHHGYQYTYVDF